MSDRRACPRWKINWQAQVKFSHKENLTNCHITDINYKGLRISLEDKLAQDTFLSLSITLSCDCVLNVEAWVAWHKPSEGRNTYGLYFNKIKEADKEKIYQFIHKHFRQEIKRQWWQEAKEEKGGEVMDDKRIFARFKARFPLRFLDLKENKEVLGQVYDISAKGIGLICNECLQPNTPLEMWLEIPDKGEPLYTRGQVVWSKPEGVTECRAGVSLERADMMGLSRALRVTQAL